MYIYCPFMHLADTFIQSDLQNRKKSEFVKARKHLL